tara:strand:+ start:137 stop:643 length:507 start_codon:yes stop_codon:yes gene_type:complete
MWSKFTIVFLPTLPDLAQTVMDQLRASNGAHPNLLMATWKYDARDYWDHLLVHPITKNGTTSYNIEKARLEKARHIVRDAGVHEFHLKRWKTDKVCNFATSHDVAIFLMFHAGARHNPAHGDRPCLSLTVGPFGEHLFNQSPMKFFDPGPVKKLIDMLVSMRPTVEEE